MPTNAQLIASALNVMATTGNNDFSTVEVIIDLKGTYVCDVGTPPAHSYNATIGKLLSELQGIKKLPGKERILDFNGRNSQTRRWKF